MSLFFIFRVVRVILLGGIVGILLIDISLLFIYQEGFRGNVSELTSAFAVYAWPISILYFSLKDYLTVTNENKRLSFIKSMVKGIFISFVTAFIVLTFDNGGVESGMGAIFAAPLILVGGSLFQLALTTIFYFKSSKRASVV